jgi:hypothetical protein
MLRHVDEYRRWVVVNSCRLEQGKGACQHRRRLHHHRGDTQSGGTVKDGTVTMESTTFTDKVGTGSFLLECSNTISGSIPAGQTLLTESNSCGMANTTFDGNLTNKGTIAIESLDEDSPAYLYDSSTSGKLTNDGTIEALAGAPGANFIQIDGQ